MNQSVTYQGDDAMNIQKVFLIHEFTIIIKIHVNSLEMCKIEVNFDNSPDSH